MINWRSILGLVLLLGGMKELYSLLANSEAVKLNYSPIYYEIGCVIWMAVGVFFIIKGTSKKPE